MIQILSRLFQDEYTGTFFGGADPGQSELKAVPGDLMCAVYSCELGWSTLCKPMKFDSVLQTITRTDCGVGGSFITDGFQVGDHIVVSGTTTYGYGYGYPDDLGYTITDVTDSVITVQSGISITETAACVNIYGVPDLTNAAIDFYYNLLGTNDADSFQSLTDVKYLQKFTGDSPAQSANNVLTPNAGSWAWWDGHAADNGYGGTYSLEPTVVRGIMSADYKVPFTIYFPFLMKPFYTADQLQIMEDAFANSSYTNSGLPVVNASNQGFPLPPQFQDGSVVRMIENIDIRFNKYDAKINHTSGITDWGKSNTAWYNQPFPSSPDSSNKTNYYLYPNGTTYLIGGVSVSEIDFNQVTDVTIKVLANSLPTNGDPFVVNFQWLPTNPSVYQNYQASVNPATFRDVFIHDRAYNTAGSAGVNGDRFGTAYQVLKNVIGTVNGLTGTLDITFSIDLGSEIKALFASLDPSDLNYKIWVTPQMATELTLEKSTRNAILCDVNLATTNKDDSSLFAITTNGTTDTHFFRYPDTNVNPVTNLSAFVGEMAYCETWFKVKSGSRVDSVENKFIVNVYDGSFPPNLVGTSDILVWNKNTSGFWNGKITEIDIQESAGLLLPENDQRNIRSIVRDSANDGGGFHAYIMDFGFQLGYQFWQNTLDFVEETANYHTQYWPVYTQDGTSSSWATLPTNYTSEIKFVQTWLIRDMSTDNVTEFIHTSDVSVYDDKLTTVAGNPTATISTRDLLGNSLSQVVPSDIQCEVRALCAGNGVTIGTPPAPYNTVMAEMTFFYDDGINQIYDTVTTEEDPITGSLWLGRPTVTVINPQSVSITNTLDPTLVNTPIRVQRIFVRLGYKI